MVTNYNNKEEETNVKLIALILAFKIKNNNRQEDEITSFFFPRKVQKFRVLLKRDGKKIFKNDILK